MVANNYSRVLRKVVICSVLIVTIMQFSNIETQAQYERMLELIEFLDKH